MELATHIVSAGGILINKFDQVLMIYNPKPNRGWEFPGGIIENGENLIEGLQREVHEETGIRCIPQRLVGVYSNIEKRPGYNGVIEIPTIVTFDFICDYTEGRLQTSPESSEVKWLSFEEALKCVHSIYYHRLYHALNYQGQIHYASYRIENQKVEFFHQQIFNPPL